MKLIILDQNGVINQSSDTSIKTPEEWIPIPGSLDLKNIPTVGDSLRDLQAAAAVGANPILVLTGKGQRTRTNKEIPANTQIFENLAMVVDTLVKHA